MLFTSSPFSLSLLSVLSPSLPLSLSLPPFLHRKPTNQITDADQLERGAGGRETATPSSQAQIQPIAIDTSTVSPNLVAICMTTDLAGITTTTQPHLIQGHTNLSPSSMVTQEDADRTLTLQVAAASSSTNRPVRPNELRIPGPGQNGGGAARKKKPFYGRSVSLDLPPRQQTLTQSSYA